MECTDVPEETSLCFLVLLSSFSWVSLSRRLWFGSRALGCAGRSRSLPLPFSRSCSSSVALETLSLSRPDRRRENLQLLNKNKTHKAYTNLQYLKETMVGAFCCKCTKHLYFDDLKKRVVFIFATSPVVLWFLPLLRRFFGVLSLEARLAWAEALRPGLKLLVMVEGSTRSGTLLRES